jgi:hypothetical protein
MQRRISSKLHTGQNIGRADPMQDFLIQKREFCTAVRQFTVKAESEADAIGMVRLEQVIEDSSTEESPLDEFFALKR